MKLLLPILLLFVSTTRSQELAIGDQLPDVMIGYSLTGDTIKTGAFAGKWWVIEFWATWCAPCVEALSDLEQSKRQLGNRLEVVAVSQESTERLKKFVSVRPTGLKIAADANGSFRKYFPHRTIPHSILIGPDGKIYAVTNPDHLTTQVLREALEGHPAELPVKKDFIDFNIDTYFKADSTLPRRFALLPSVEGIGGQSKIYNDGPFKGRRMTIVNVTLDKLFGIAYNKSYAATINEYDDRELSWDEQEKFCLDAWIDTADELQLMNYIRQELHNHFVDVNAMLEKKKRKVWVVTADHKAALLKPSEDKRHYYNGRQDQFDGFGVTLDQLAEYIESFQIYRGMAINETGIAGHFDIQLQFEPENRETFKKALAGIGLSVSEREKEIEMLVLKKR